MKKAVIVYNTEPIIGNLIPSLVRLDGNVNKYLSKLNKAIEDNGLNWEVQ